MLIKLCAKAVVKLDNLHYTVTYELIQLRLKMLESAPVDPFPHDSIL